MKILILGASSDVGKALARKFAMLGHDIILAGRDSDRLESQRKDIEIRFKANVDVLQFDAVNFSSHKNFYRSLTFTPDVVICVFGYLGKQTDGERNWNEAENILNTNFCGAVSILNIVAEDFAIKRSGIIVGISSVAGERGRQSNYLYGSAKAGFTAYLSGLRNRMMPYGVHVCTVKPGFMKTSMTENIKLPKRLTASPTEAAEAIYKATIKKKNVVYVLGVWRLIMLVIRFLPEAVFKRLKL